MTPMQELKQALAIPVTQGIIKHGPPLHERKRCLHGRPTCCWQCGAIPVFE